MAKPLRRMTMPTRMVLSVFLDSPNEEHYGLDIARSSGLKAGSLYPILRRLEDAGWLEARWEADEEAAEDRPRRRYYRITDDGLPLARQTVETSPLTQGWSLRGVR